jgi:hypothetical protein
VVLVVAAKVLIMMYLMELLERLILVAVAVLVMEMMIAPVILVDMLEALAL